MNYHAVPVGWLIVLAESLLVLALIRSPLVMAQNTFAHVPSEEMATFSAGSNAGHEESLTLKEAVRLVLLYNPELASFDKEVRALEGVRLQAGLLRNPDLSVNLDNVGNMGVSQRGTTTPGATIKENVEQQDLIIRISQLIELGGKRAARVHAASLGREVAGKDYEAKRLELVARVANIFTEVVAGQEQLRLAEESQQLARQVVDAVKRRVEAGKVPPIEETRVGVAFSATRIAVAQAQRDLLAARKRLVLLWGDTSPAFGKALGSLDSHIILPSFDTLVDRALSSPMADRARRGIAHRKALLEVEQTLRVPNITLGGGMIKHWESGGTTGVVGISMPLQLFDRNQGNIREAHQRLDKALDEQAATELSLRTELVQAYEGLVASENEIAILRSEILPAAKSAFEVTNKGYELGKFGFLEVLDTQRTLFQNQVLYVRAQANYQRLVNEIERLIAAPIDHDPEIRMNDEAYPDNGGVDG